MAQTWNETTKATLRTIGDAVKSGRGGLAEVQALRDLPAPVAGPTGLCTAHTMVWNAMRAELAKEAPPEKSARRAWSTHWIERHERVSNGITGCSACERPAPAPPTGFASDGGHRGGRRGPPRR